MELIEKSDEEKVYIQDIIPYQHNQSVYFSTDS